MHIIFNMFGKMAAICTEVIFNRVCFNIFVCIGDDKFLPSSRLSFEQQARQCLL